METDKLLESSENSAERIEAVTFLSKLATLVHDGQEDTAMQRIYSHLYALRMAGRYTHGSNAHAMGCSSRAERLSPRGRG